jgi:multiple antibiotic resistance protein
MPTVEQLLSAFLVVPLALLPIMNPLSGATIFMTMAGPDPANVNRFARMVSINCWYVIVGSLLIGTYVLDIFGISLAIVRVGGGLLVASSAWRMLSSNDDDEVREALARSEAAARTPEQIAERSFFPMTFPLTTGPGTIAAAIAIGAGLPRQPARYLIEALTAMAGATLTVLVVYLVYRNAPRLIHRLGTVGALVMARLMAFVLLCIGIQILWTGWAELNGLPKP